MRSCLTSGICPLLPSWPALAAALIGDSGGTYQTIGSVRYSGCSGRATFHSITIFHTGLLRAPSSHASGMPSARACAITFGSFGSRKMSHCAWYRSRSRSTLAASWMRSASYSSTPR